MDPLLELLLACAAFVATHCVASTPLRARLVGVLGERAYVGLHSAVALVTLGWMILAYYRAPVLTLWSAPAARLAPLLVMPFSLVLLVCGLGAPNPATAGGERLLATGEPARGIVRVTRHPLLWAIALWAGAHAAARGDAAALVFFGTFALLAAAGTWLIDRRKATLGPGWERFARATSNLPFAAIAAGRNRFEAREIGWTRPAIGLALYLVLLALHPLLFGARPY